MATPTEYQTRIAQIQRRRELANAMMQNSLQPINAPMSGTGNYPIQTQVSPWQIAGQLAQAYMAKKANERADKDYSEIASAMGAEKQKALQGLQVPADMGPMPAAPPATSSDEGPTHAPVAPPQRQPRVSAAQIQAAVDAGVDPAAIAAATKRTAPVQTSEHGALVDPDTGQVIYQGSPTPDYKPEEMRRENARDAEIARHNHELEKAAANRIGAGPGGGITDEGRDLAAQEYLNTGKLPALGRAAAIENPKIIARAAQMAAANGDDAKAATLHRAAFGAGKQALGALTKQRTMVGAFERTALKNLEIAAAESEKVDRTGSPAINRWLLKGKKNIAGDVEVGRFNAALTSALNEYAKVLSGATGAAGITDSARKEAEELISTANTPEQVRGIIDIMKREMANREAGFAEQEQQLHESMGGGAPVTVDPAARGAPQAPGAAMPPKELTYDPATGTFK